jgi:hypothetical protein
MRARAASEAAIVAKAAQCQTSPDLALTEQAALAFASQTKTLAKLERYDCRALSLRNRWLESLSRR